jgi:uncharacterized membrane protein
LNLFIGRLLLRYTDRFLSRWTVFGLDLLLVLATYLVAQFIAFNFEASALTWPIIGTLSGLVLLTCAMCLLNAGFYVQIIANLKCLVGIKNAFQTIYAKFTQVFRLNLDLPLFP